MIKAKEWLKGKKSNLVGLSMIIAGIIKYIETEDISATIELILAGLAVMGLRAGIKKGEIKK